MLNQGSIITWTISVAVFYRIGCCCSSLHTGGICRNSQIYCSKQFPSLCSSRSPASKRSEIYTFGACRRSPPAATSDSCVEGRWPGTDRFILKALISQIVTFLLHFWLQHPPPSRSLIMSFVLPNFPVNPVTPRRRGFRITVAAWLKQRAPDRSISNLHSQQSVTDSMPTKPSAIHYREGLQGEACPTAAC